MRQRPRARSDWSTFTCVSVFPSSWKFCLDSRQNFQELGKTETHVKVLQSDRARGLCRIGDFVGLIRVGESDRERLDPVRGMLLRAGRDQRRIDTTTQKDAHLDVRKQLALDRLLQQ